jgi:hypothetical protein
MLRSRLLTVALAVALVPAFAGSAQAAHEGNNRAAVEGTGAPGATGNAVVNYRAGSGTFNGSITVRGLMPGTTYTFSVRRPGPETTICSAVANRGGVFTCSAQDLRLPGFTDAVVRDAAGAEVALGTFSRGGNCRSPDQAGSQCTAPGQSR